MTELATLYTDLEKYKDFSLNDNSEKFLETIDKIIICQNPESISIILNYFDDNSDYSWVFESASSALEHYPMDVYVTELLKELPILLEKAPIWADGFFNKILNQNDYRFFFELNIYLAPKKSLLKLFEIMEVESPHHHRMIKKLIEKLDE